MNASRWAGIVDALHLGESRPSRPEPDHFSIAVEQRAFDRLDRGELGVVLAAWSSHHRSLSSARNGARHTSWSHLRRADTILQHPTLGAEAIALIGASHGGILAYLHYRDGEFTEANRVLHETLASDCVLRDDFGYSIYELHRAQLVHNMVRVEARRGDPDAAVDLAAGLLAWLRHPGAPWPLPDRQARPELLRLLGEQPASMDLQVTIELAQITSRLQTAARAVLIERVDSRLGKGTDRITDVWRACVRAGSQGSEHEFLEHACTVLAAGAQDAAALWNWTALEVSVWAANQVGGQDLADACRNAAMGNRTLAASVAEPARQRIAV